MGSAPVVGSRLAFIDNLRTAIIILVILVHLSVTYGGAGGWYYSERPTTEPSFILLTFFNAVCQSFFMGLLFLLSAYLTVGSYDRKGPGLFLRDRFLRLGIPLLVFEFVIHPFQLYPLIQAGAVPVEGSFRDWLAHYYSSFHMGNGPLWFVETLLAFAWVYTAIRLVKPRGSRPDAQSIAPPGSRAILVFSLTLGILTFIVRLWFPFGWALGPLNLQLCFFTQYIAMLVVGVVAYRHDWLMRIPDTACRPWLGLAAFLIAIVLPAMFVLGGATKGNVASFAGGWHWQALAYAMWDQLMGVAMIVGLVALFRKHFNRQGRIAHEASASSYATYVVHTPILILCTLAIRNVAIYPLLKFVLVSLILVPLCFLLAAAIRRLPGARRVL